MFAYQNSPLEDYIEKIYKKIGITDPYQLDLVDIADKLNIWIHFENIDSKAFELNDNYSVIIDRRLSPKEQWQDFGHELCHLLRQSGNQLLLSDDLIDFQETKANNFAFQFCIPTFMLLNISFPHSTAEAVTYIADTFNVTNLFAKDRLARFERQIMSQQFSQELAAAFEAQDNLTKLANCDQVLNTGIYSMLYSRDRGVLGYFRDGVIKRAK